MVKLQKNKKQAPKKSLKFKKRGFQNQKMKKKTKNQPATQERYSKMSVDDLLNKSLDSSSTDSEIEEQDETIENELFNDDASNKSEDEDALSDTEAGSGDEILCHKESLAKLKDTDPEFYKFLQENDKKLLDFNLSDSEGEEKDDDAEDDDMKGDLHKPSGELEVASDESDFEVSFVRYLVYFK